ncbi:hypothetical protein J6590_003870 [Homalodisca vitripennis]|nr:hypothetical protein J6590_003870 [Homalodisca vitripennis]
MPPRSEQLSATLFVAGSRPEEGTSAAGTASRDRRASEIVSTNGAPRRTTLLRLNKQVIGAESRLSLGLLSICLNSARNHFTSASSVSIVVRMPRRSLVSTTLLALSNQSAGATSLQEASRRRALSVRHCAS